MKGGSTGASSTASCPALSEKGSRPGDVGARATTGSWEQLGQAVMSWPAGSWRSRWLACGCQSVR